MRYRSSLACVSWLPDLSRPGRVLNRIGGVFGRRLLWGRMASCGGLSARLPRAVCKPQQADCQSAAGSQPAPHSGKPQTVQAFLRGCTLVDDEVRNDGPRRNAMQQFIAKFEKDIQGGSISED